MVGRTSSKESYLSPIPILLQTDDWLVVDKPPGISIHNNEDPENLIKVLVEQTGAVSLYPVHRLDRETSGVQIFALHKKSAQQLSGEFESDRVGKYYEGLVKGQLKNLKGVWDKALTDKAEGRRVPQGVSRDRVPCVTEYKVIRSSKFLSHCEFRLLSGRQHQIRKHAALAKHPLVGDTRYGNKALNAKISGLYDENRMFLHCREIEILGEKLISKNSPSYLKFFEGHEQ